MDGLLPLAQATYPDLWFIFWWAQDANVWAAILSFAIGLVGAVVGGWFTLAAAKRARKQQIEDMRRAAADQDARSLHTKFVDLMNTVDNAPSNFAVAIGAVSWYPEWKLVWTRQLRTELRVGADVIPDADARNALTTVIGHLNNAEDHSRDGAWPGRPSRDLRGLVGSLAAEGVAILSAYRRGDQHATSRQALLDKLANEAKDHAIWEARSEAASERAAEEWWQSLSEEDRIKAKGDHENVIAAIRNGASSKGRRRRKGKPGPAESGR
ncbi:hypothetical protein [Microbacterium sp. CCH5-D1]|uniref:hypothetical protein n=1 Tax=Microbacterium sp. CCH5-D1 TaxID=1768780 RepID=UPI0012F80973|nr:hypothetical protein [Microbacterium sp. CCH5-D1]